MSSRYRTLQAQGGGYDEFTIVMDTTKSGTNTDVKLQFLGTANLTYDVDWGDGSSNTYTHTGGIDTQTKDYGVSGKFTIKMSGNIGQFNSIGLSDDERDQIVNILDFGKPANVILTSNQSHVLQNLGSGYVGRSLSKVRNGVYPHFIADTSCNLFLAETNCISSNLQLENWPSTTTGNIKFAEGMFSGSTMSNGEANSTIIDLTGWDTSNLVIASSMFGGVRPGSFDNNNLTIVCSTWDMTSCANLHAIAAASGGLEMQGCENWNISNCTDISYFADNNGFFNSNVATWNTANVTNMDSVFNNATNFNQPIGVWNTANVTRMDNMFTGASAFNQDLTGWNILNMTSFPGMDGMLDNSGMSTENYSKWLINCANQVSSNSDLPANVFLGAANITYSNVTYAGTPYNDGESARDYLVNTAGWIITDGGLV